MFNTDITKYVHTTCLSSTSIWILVPGILAYKKKLYITPILFILSCVSSMIHWTWYQKNSIRYYFDILCANILLAYHILGFGIMIPNIYILGILVSGILIFFNLACFHPIGSWSGLISHLIFRYCFYWCIILYYITFNITVYILNSLLFIFTIYLIINNLANIYLINMLICCMVFSFTWFFL